MNIRIIVINYLVRLRPATVRTFLRSRLKETYVFLVILYKFYYISVRKLDLIR